MLSNCNRILISGYFILKKVHVSIQKTMWLSILWFSHFGTSPSKTTFLINIKHSLHYTVGNLKTIPTFKFIYACKQAVLFVLNGKSVKNQWVKLL